jgi:hypothetical protein
MRKENRKVSSFPKKMQEKNRVVRTEIRSHETISFQANEKIQVPEKRQYIVLRQ